MEPNPEKIRAIARSLEHSARLYDTIRYNNPRRAKQCRRYAKKLYAKADRQEAKLK